MKTSLIFSGIIAAGLIATPVLAAESAVTGAAGGAVTGAIVGGPVGAAVGGVIGAIAGTALAPPPAPVILYVKKQPLGDEQVIVGTDVEVGAKLPDNVALMKVPNDPKYSYTIVNGQRVIVDPQTHIVVGVVG